MAVTKLSALYSVFEGGRCAVAIDDLRTGIPMCSVLAFAVARNPAVIDRGIEMLAGG